MEYFKILSFKNIKDYGYGDPEDYNTYVFLNPEDKPSIEQINTWNVDYKKYECKQKAKKRIAEYDWVIDTETTPDLLNREDFIAYRSALRQLILNPVENPVWPEFPQEEWA